MATVWRALPLSGDSEERSDEFPPVGFGVHVHAEVHGSLQESEQGSFKSSQHKAQTIWTPFLLASPHLVYEVSVDTVGQLLDEGVHD